MVGSGEEVTVRRAQQTTVGFTFQNNFKAVPSVFLVFIKPKT